MFRILDFFTVTHIGQFTNDCKCNETTYFSFFLVNLITYGDINLIILMQQPEEDLEVNEQEEVDPKDEGLDKKAIDAKHQLKDMDLASIFVNNLEENTTEADLRDYFKDCGTIVKITTRADKFAGTMYSYIQFQDKNQAEDALLLHEGIIRGRKINVFQKRTNLRGRRRGARGDRGLSIYFFKYFQDLYHVEDTFILSLLKVEEHIEVELNEETKKLKKYFQKKKFIFKQKKQKKIFFKTHNKKEQKKRHIMTKMSYYNSRGFAQQAPLPAGYLNVELSQTQQIQPPLPDYFTTNPPQKLERSLPSQITPQKIQKLNQPSPRGKHYFINWIVCLLPILFILAILIAIIVLFASKPTYHVPHGAHGVFKSLQYNLKSDPIQDIVSPIPKSTLLEHKFNHHSEELKCPETYFQANIGQWDGVKKGCLCQDGEIKGFHNCWFSSDQCKSVDDYDSIILKTWQGTFLCLKLETDSRQLKGQSCNDGYHLCDGNICVPPSHTCPITDLKSGSGTLLIKDKKFSKVVNVGQPIVELQVSPNGKPLCLNSELNPKYQSQKYYPLAKQPEVGCDDYGDFGQYTVQLDIQKAEELYAQNQLTNKLNGIPFYKKFEDESDTLGLQGIRRIATKNIPECQTLQSDHFEQVVSQGLTIHAWTYTLAVIILVLAVLSLIVAIILYLLRKSEFDSFEIAKYRQPYLYAILAVIIAIICIIFGILYFSQLGGDNGLEQHNERLQTYIKEQCFNNNGIHKALDEVVVFGNHSYKTSHSSVMTIFYLSIAFLILLLIALIYQNHELDVLFSNPWAKKLYSQFE
ncbi:hypothetical protein pb186bvf_005883 [Paramecium bursaria]